MRIFTFIIITLLFSLDINAQTRRMNNAVTGKTYTSERQNHTVQPLLIEAERRFRISDYEGAILTLESAVALNPYSAEALTMRAKYKKIMGMQTEAEADLRLVNNINPLAASLFGYHGKGGLLSVLSIEPKEALQELDNLQRLRYYRELLAETAAPNEELDRMLGSVELIMEYMEANELEEALTASDTLIELFPKSAIAYDLKGTILRKQGKFEDAAEVISTAVVLEPDFALPWYHFALIEKSAGNYEQAKAYLDRAIELEGNLIKAYFDRALIFKKMGEYDKAIQDYSKIIDLEIAFYTQAFLNRGLTKKMAGDYTGALNDLNHAAYEFPFNAEVRKSRGNLQLLLGYPRKAMDEYTKAIELKDDYAEAYHNRAITNFLLYNKISGCADLNVSAELGYEPAIEARKYFCPQ